MTHDPYKVAQAKRAQLDRIYTALTDIYKAPDFATIMWDGDSVSVKAGGKSLFHVRVAPEPDRPDTIRHWQFRLDAEVVWPSDIYNRNSLLETAALVAGNWLFENRTHGGDAGVD